jgi:hypothetical protein
VTPSCATAAGIRVAHYEDDAASAVSNSPNDTSREAAAIQAQIIDRLTVAQRLELAVEMSLAARALAKSRLREEHPTWSDVELDRELLRFAFMPNDLPPGVG